MVKAAIFRSWLGSHNYCCTNKLYYIKKYVSSKIKLKFIVPRGTSKLKYKYIKDILINN